MAKKAIAIKIVAAVAVLGAAFWAYKRYFAGAPAGWAYANEGTGSAGWRAPGGSAFYYGLKSERPWGNPGLYRRVNNGTANSFSLTGVGATS